MGTVLFTSGYTKLTNVSLPVIFHETFGFPLNSRGWSSLCDTCLSASW